MFTVPHRAYTAEFKADAVQRIKDGQGLSAVARELGMYGSGDVRDPANPYRT